ncbi:MAG: hypothetical protein PWQ43_831 [Rikenellaceae bacterium]|jgi:hypothetical protein|nr:hypothetical protein [Rikenellaceae bacterium]MDN5355889.1 hypothetical protein [Rikenellaceae bacterium]
MGTNGSDWETGETRRLGDWERGRKGDVVTRRLGEEVICDKLISLARY